MSAESYADSLKLNLSTRDMVELGFDEMVDGQSFRSTAEHPVFVRSLVSIGRRRSAERDKMIRQPAAATP